MTQLSSSDPDSVRPAAEQLGDMGPFAGTAVPELMERLQPRNQNEMSMEWIAARVAVVEALGKIGAAAEPAVPLIVTNSDHSTFWNPVALEALVRIQDATGRVVPYLLQLVQDRQKHVENRERAVVALGAMGPRADHTLRALLELIPEREHIHLTIALWKTAARLRPDEAAVARAIELFSKGAEKDDERYGRVVLWCFRAWGPAAKPAIPAVLAFIERNPSWGGHWIEAFAVLARIDPRWGETEAGREFLPKLVALNGEWAPAPFEAFGSAAIPHLIAALDRAGRSAEALDRVQPNWRARPEARQAVRALQSKLVQCGSNPFLLVTSGDVWVRGLRAADPDWFASVEASDTLAKMLNLVESRSVTDVSAVHAVGEMLAVYGPAAKPHLPQVLKLFDSVWSGNHEQTWCGEIQIADWLGSLAQTDAALARQLEQRLPSIWARKALGRAGAPAFTPKVRAALLKVAFEGDRAAVDHLTRIDPKWGTWPEVPGLLETLWVPSSEEMWTIRAIKEMQSKDVPCSGTRPPFGDTKLATLQTKLGTLLSERAVLILAAVGDQIGPSGERFAKALDLYWWGNWRSNGDLESVAPIDTARLEEGTVALWKLGGRKRSTAEFVLRYRAADSHPVRRAGAEAALARLGLN
jgi:hypothetical protein